MSILMSILIGIVVALLLIAIILDANMWILIGILFILAIILWFV